MTTTLDSSIHLSVDGESKNSLSPPSPCGVDNFPVEKIACPPSMECSLPSISPIITTARKTSTQKNKRVRFRTQARGKITLSHHDMTPMERCDYWLQDYEYTAIDQHNQRTIDAIEKSFRDIENNDNDDSRHSRQTEDDDEDESESSCDSDDHCDNEMYCLRGLENELEHERRRSLIYWEASLEGVLREQEEQFHLGIYDDQAIAQEYSQIAKKCRFRARLRALLDREEIEDYLRE